MSDFPSPDFRRENEDTSPTEASTYRCTRWIMRILAILLLVATLASIVEVISQWGDLNHVEAAAADVFDQEGFWIHGWPRVGLAGSLAFAVLTVPVVAGLWRFRPGAWLAGVVFGVLALLSPFFIFLILGAGGVMALHTGYWSLWALSVAALGYLLMRRTREVMGARPVVWVTPWLAVILPWLAISPLIPAGVIALKQHLAREQGVPFWAASTIEDLGFSHGDLDDSDWVQANLSNLSFPVPPDARLITFPAKRDPYGMVTLAAGSEGTGRELIILTGKSTLEMYPLSVMERVGTDDGMDFARKTRSDNWSYWPLLYSHITAGERERAYWLEDDERRVLALLSSANSGDHRKVRLSVQRESGSEIADVIYMLGSDVTAARIARMAARLHPKNSASDGSISGNGDSGVSRDLRLLEDFWEGNLDAGFKLADILLGREERALHAISRLIDRLGNEAPTDSRLPDLKRRLDKPRDE